MTHEIDVRLGADGTTQLAVDGHRIDDVEGVTIKADTVEGTLVQLTLRGTVSAVVETCGLASLQRAADPGEWIKIPVHPPCWKHKTTGEERRDPPPGWTD